MKAGQDSSGQIVAKLIQFYKLNPNWLLQQSPDWIAFLAHHMSSIEISSRLEFIQDMNAAMNPKSGQQHVRNLESKLRFASEPMPTKREVRASLKALKAIKKRSRFA